jgi:spermidine synthase
MPRKTALKDPSRAFGLRLTAVPPVLSPRLPVVPLFVFFLSGFAALLYQVIWQRMLAVFSGADAYSSTLIVAAFMAGLGVGHLAGGHAADRLSRRKALMVFAGAELCIAAFSLMSRALYYDFLYQRLGTLAPAPALLTAILFVSLLWPTFFMGMSLPLLAKAVTRRIERAAATVGALYGFNTLGAATGAFLATWWILPGWGLEGSLRIGAWLNLLCAAAVLPLASRLARSGTLEPGVAADPDVKAGPMAPDPASATLPFFGWAALYALSGLMALSLEIVWFRLLGVMMKSTAFTFGTLLAIYLTGLGGGALIGSRFTSRLRRPAATFLLLQAAVGLSACCLLAILLGSVNNLESLRRYFGSYDPLSVRDGVQQLRSLSLPREFILLYFGLPAVLILPPTLLMGYSFPVLQRIVQTDFSRLGRRIGLLMVANIAGSVIGTMLTGWVALSALGTAGTLKVVSGFSAVFALTAIGLWMRASGHARADRTLPPLVAAAGVMAVVGCAMFVVLPDSVTLWARLHGTTGERLIFGEDASGLSVLRLEPGSSQGRTTVFVNGVGQSTIPYGDVHTGLGMVPAFLHPNPREVAIIGLGSGDTVYGMAGRPQIARITCIEIIGPQIEGLRALRHRNPYGGLLGLLEDPRIDYIAGDGRIFLMRSAAKFDIIEADALRPSSAYSGNLYSEEYFTLVRNRLRPQGLAATWLPTARVHNAFVRVFPYVVSVPGILVGSNDPIDVDRDAIAKRLADPHVREHYARAGIDAEQLMSSYLIAPARYGPDFDRTRLTDFNTDLFPKDEYDLSPPQ